MMEVFPKVKAVIDMRTFKDREREAYKIICSNKGQIKIGVNCYEVTGSFQEIDQIHTRLLKLKAGPSASPNHHAELCIDKIYSDYILAIYRNQLRNIEQECNVAIKRTEQAGTCKFEFLSASPPPQCKILPYAAKERFITLYQHIATNFDIKTIDLCNFSKETSEKGIRAFLQKEFPKVVVDLKGPKLTLTGNHTETKRAEIALFSNKWQSNRLKSVMNTSASNMDITDSSTKPLSSPARKSSSAAAGSKLESKAEDKICPVCLDEINDRETLTKCKHSFCRECIKMAFRIKSACPICGEVYGELTGNQPQAGTMKSFTKDIHLPGYEKYDTIVINYSIPDGVQGPEHPSPGQRYTGTGRVAYLPDIPEGRKVHKLLERAFNQRLIFTIGTSSTTGRSNVVTWNDIHHKTSTTGGPSMYGYPDPTYLDRVQDELKAKGIH